jgi:hypothetical protein
MSTVISDVKCADHQTEADQVVRARAVIGEGQNGGWVMLLGDAHKAGGAAAKWVELGTGAELKGKHLEVSAVIQDTRAETDRLSLTVEVTGGPKTTSVHVAHVGKPGDGATYSIIVFFS